MTKGSSAARGSSNKTILGLLIITLAIINLRISPPDNTEALRVLKCCKLNSSSNFSVTVFTASDNNYFSFSLPLSLCFFLFLL